jgi:hypothetical protein
MSTDESQDTEPSSRETLHDRARAWWSTVLVGQLNGSHPIHGTAINAALQGETLVITGAVPTAQDRRDIEAEVAHLQGKGFTTLQNDLVVSDATADHAGLLTQTLFAVFESAEAAAFAQSYLIEHVQVHPEQLIVFAASAPDAAQRIAEYLPEASREDGQRALDAGRSLLIVTVDETEAFKTRELLDEETRSLQTVVLPPAAASGWQAVAADIAAPDDEHEAPARVTPERGLDFGTGSAT